MHPEPPPDPSGAPSLVARCHCGRVRIELPRTPETLTQCDCSVCRRYGTLWAYYTEGEVAIRADAPGLAGYAWGPRHIRFMRCAACGVVMHWQMTHPAPSNRIGINARNLDPQALGPVRLRRLDGAVTERYLD